jgi:hypothetical protein
LTLLLILLWALMLQERGHPMGLVWVMGLVLVPELILVGVGPLAMLLLTFMLSIHKLLVFLWLLAPLLKLLLLALLMALTLLGLGLQDSLRSFSSSWVHSRTTNRRGRLVHLLVWFVPAHLKGASPVEVQLSPRRWCC